MASGFKTGGRRKGSRNRKTVLLEEKGRKALAEALGPHAIDVDAHSLLTAIYKNEAAAIRFEKPALAALDAHETVKNVHYVISDQPLARRSGKSSTASRTERVWSQGAEAGQKNNASRY
jgi:hypothetical protein